MYTSRYQYIQEKMQRMYKDQYRKGKQGVFKCSLELPKLSISVILDKDKLRVINYSFVKSAGCIILTGTCGTFIMTARSLMNNKLKRLAVFYDFFTILCHLIFFLFNLVHCTSYFSQGTNVLISFVVTSL